MKSRKVCIKTKPTLSSLSLKGQLTEQTTIKWAIGNDCFSDSFMKKITGERKTLERLSQKCHFFPWNTQISVDNCQPIVPLKGTYCLDNLPHKYSISPWPRSKMLRVNMLVLRDIKSPREIVRPVVPRQ